MKKIILGASIVLALVSCKQPDTAVATRKDLTLAVFANGELYKSDEYVVTANTDGFISTLLVEEGDWVKVGVAIASLSADVQNLNVDIARTTYEDAAAKASGTSPEVLQLQTQIAQAKIQLRHDEVNYNRYAALQASQSVAQADFESARLKYEASKAQVEILENSLAEMRNAFSLAAKNAQKQLLIQQENAGEYTLSSKIDGQVLARYKRQGELVRRGEAIALIGGGSDKIRLYIAEEDISKVQQGQKVNLILNPSPNIVYQASIAKVYPAFDTQSQSFVADAVFLQTPEHLIAGTQVQANILLEQRRYVLAIPATAIIKPNKVQLKTGEEKTVRLGQQANGWVEIVEGLAENEEIVLQNKAK